MILWSGLPEITIKVSWCFRSITNPAVSYRTWVNNQIMVRSGTIVIKQGTQTWNKNSCISCALFINTATPIHKRYWYITRNMKSELITKFCISCTLFISTATPIQKRYWYKTLIIMIIGTDQNFDHMQMTNHNINIAVPFGFYSAG